MTATMRRRARTIAACDAYRAWRVTSGETYPLDIGNPETLHDALNEANRALFLSLPLPKMARVAFKLVR